MRPLRPKRPGSGQEGRIGRLILLFLKICAVQSSRLVGINKNQDITEASLVIKRMLGIFDPIFDLVISQMLGEGPCCHRVFQVVLAPSFVGSIQMDRPCDSTFLQANVSIGLQKLMHIVAVLHSLLQIVSGAFGLCKLVVIGDEPFQTFHHPKEDTFCF